jgi:hypothetical protein
MNNWQNDPATEKQVASITRMNSELGWNEAIPATKGEAGITIGKMKTEQKRRRTSRNKILTPVY